MICILIDAFTENKLALLQSVCLHLCERMRGYFRQVSNQNKPELLNLSKLD